MTSEHHPDISARQVLAQTWTLLRKQPGLWSPPLVLNLLLALLAGNGARGTSILLPMACAWLLTIAFRAGWLEQMHRVVEAGEGKEERATWSQFLEGVGRYFWRFLGGELAQLVLLAGGLAVAVAIGAQQYGWPDAALFKQFLDAARQSGDALQKLPQSTIDTLNAWTLVLVSWAGYWAIVAVTLLFWQTYAVWGNKPWPKAWLASLQAVSRHLRLVLPLVLLQTLGYMIVFQLLASGPGFLMVLGYAGYLIVWTVFSLALFLVLQRWDPHAAPAPERP